MQDFMNRGGGGCQVGSQWAWVPMGVRGMLHCKLQIFEKVGCEIRHLGCIFSIFNCSQWGLQPLQPSPGFAPDQLSYRRMCSFYSLQTSHQTFSQKGVWHLVDIHFLKKDIKLVLVYMPP